LQVKNFRAPGDLQHLASTFRPNTFAQLQSSINSRKPYRQQERKWRFRARTKTCWCFSLRPGLYPRPPSCQPARDTNKRVRDGKRSWSRFRPGFEILTGAGTGSKILSFSRKVLPGPNQIF